VSKIAKVEVTSEDAQLPIEGAFTEGDKRGWPASERGKQTIRLIFDEPQRIPRIWLRFIELHEERTQQFALQWSRDKNDTLRPLFQQQWNFSPSGSTSQIEDYEVELNGVWMLQLVIDPDIAGGQQSPLSKTGVSLKESKETQRIRDADPLINWLRAYDRLISVKNFLKADSSASCLDVEA
jgi:hypothetical protein